MGVLCWYPNSAIALSVPTQVALQPSHYEVEQLSQWLIAKGCPNDAVWFVEAAQEYGIDYRTLPAIWWKESQCGLHQLNGNGFGWEPTGSLRAFTSIKEAIFYISEALTEPPYAGKTLKRQIYTYNSVGEPRYYENFETLTNQMQ